MKGISFFLTEKQDLVLRLFDEGVFKDKRSSKTGNGFELKLHEKYPSAPLSPFYINLRSRDHPTNPGSLNQQLKNKVGEMLFWKTQMEPIKFNQVAGIPQAGEPLAEAFAKAAKRHKQKVDLIKLKKEQVGEKRRIAIDEEVDSLQKVLLIDDLVTKADTKLEAIEAVESKLGKVAGILTVIDREQGGREELLKRGYRVYCLFGIRWMLEKYLITNRISSVIFEEIKNYL